VPSSFVVDLLLTFIAAALGSMVWVFILTKVLEGSGIRWALGILAMSSAVLLSLASALALPPRKFETRCTHIVSWETFMDPLFVSLAIANFLHPLTIAIPMVFGPQFAESIGASMTQASYLLAINSAVGIPGRLCTGWLADKIGHLNVLIVATAIYASAIWALWLSSALTSNMGLYVAMSVCHGISNGVFNTVMASAQKTLFGPEMYYPKMGATMSIRGIGYVIGTPIADEDLRGGGFVRPIVYTGVLVTISLLCLVNVRWLDAKKDGWKLAR
jgi:MFS family permease